MEGPQTRTGLVLGIVLVWSHCAFGLNPSLDVNQYAHTAWKTSEGFTKGVIFSLAQTPDGYLWLGTEFGLVRFDGARAVPWQPPAGERLPSNDVRKLSVARDGRLWIGTIGGLASWKDGRLTHYPELNGKTIETLFEDRQGTVWVGAWAPPAGRLCAIQSAGTQCYGEEGRFGSAVTALYEDSGGSLWAGASTGLWRWNPGPPKLYPMPDPTRRIHALIEDGGELLIAKNNGMIRLGDGRFEAYPLFAGFELEPKSLLRDRNGDLWVGEALNQGLLHVHARRTDLYTRSDGLSGNAVTALLEDREGNIWVATTDGLDRFRKFAVHTMSAKQGFFSRGVESILAARDGSIWMGADDGLQRWNNGRITTYRKPTQPARGGGNQKTGLPEQTAGFTEIIARELPDNGVSSLFENSSGQIWVATLRGMAIFDSGRLVPSSPLPPGIVYSMAEGAAGSVWISRDDGLFRLIGAKVAERIPLARFGKGVATALMHDRLREGLWVGFLDGGVVFFADGKIRASYTAGNGLGAGRVNGFNLGDDGTLWVSTEGGLSRLKDTNLATLTSGNGLPCNATKWVVEDNAHSFWLYMPCGLVRIARSELDAWAVNARRTIQATVFDNSDGFISHSFTSGYSPPVAKAPDGTLWFNTFGVVSVIDPHNLPFNNLPPPVHIESVIADDKQYSLRPGIRLPANIRNLRIEYTALSLIAPEKVHFKYKLEGQNQNWHEVVNERYVTYTNLAPRQYRFQVIACNNSGVWNETGDTLEFSIAPAYYQTNWFRALVAAVLMSLLAAGYQLRVWRVQRESRRLRDVIETIPASVWSAQPDGSIDFINRRWRELSGLPLEQGLGWEWAQVVHPEDRAGLIEAWRAAVASGKALEAEARLRGADGEYRWQLIRSVPQKDASGKIVKWYGQTTDIDDRKRAEETLRETETRFRTYIDHATDAFFVLDFEGGTILDVNHRACKNLGYTREDLVGKTVFEFEAGLDAEWLERNVRPRIEAGESVTFETQHRRKDGSVFPVEIRARAFQSGGRTVNLSLVQDITERKRAEEERERLRQMEIDLAHINRVSMMGELAASVAHEVNQPLTGIVSNGSACLRWLGADGPIPAPDAEEIREAVRDMVRDGKRAGEIIQRIRALTKKAELPRETLDLNETILDVLALVGDEAKKDSVTVRTQLADEVSPVHADRVQLQQVLLNLVMNAIQAMSSVNDRERQLVIATRNIDHQVQVTVEDSGTGLDPDKIAKIFEPFYTTKSGGMGMGLSICRSILQNHGGRLWAAPNEGPGASFHFTLPKHQDENQKAGAAAD